MELSDFLVETALVEEMAAKEKEPAIRELVLALNESGAIKAKEVESVVDALMKREELGSTGIGKGVAVPHARHPAIRKLVGAFGHSSQGIEFAALDGEPVHAIFLLISPSASTGQHLEALALISRMLRNNTFCRLLRETTGRDKLVELLRDAHDFLT
ncbi:MAG: PTS sugar transporter subunit IIA [Planctomycetes bacterium]|nr:PTS sugar transporter subunit IIA [Planctomycetota bacterium]